MAQVEEPPCVERLKSLTFAEATVDKPMIAALEEPDPRSNGRRREVVAVAETAAATPMFAEAAVEQSTFAEAAVDKPTVR